jgi:hypothetical protein
MVNWAKQDMVFKNHEKQSINGFLKPRAWIKYANLYLQDKKYLGIIFIQIYYSQIFKENMDKWNDIWRKAQVTFQRGCDS